MKLPGRTLSSTLSTEGREVVLVEAIPCSAGERFSLAFESAETRWRQGVWLAVEGSLALEGSVGPQIVVWRDAAPSPVEIAVNSTDDGLLRLYNVWDSGRGLGKESQKATSGMLREVLGDGFRFRCSDINAAPTFEALVFTLKRSG